LIFIGVALALVVGLVWVPAVAAISADIIIHKTVEEGCPLDETFTFEAWRDMNDNGIIDDPGDDFKVDTATITGQGKVTITVDVLGPYVIRELPVAGWEPNPDQPVYVACDEHVYFHNRCIPCTGQIEILKLDELGAPLADACFELTPDPRTCEGSLELCDNGPNDEDSADGVLYLSGLQVCCEFTVTETVAPPGYELDPTSYPAHVEECGETVVLTVVNIPEEEYGQIMILKEDPAGNALEGACFVISPDPTTGITGSSLTVCDNFAPDISPLDGVLLVDDCLVCVPVTVTETVAPDGYELDPTPQPAHITTAGQTVTLTFVNTPQVDCGTVCAAQTGPGEFLFSSRQSNWFTWICYDIGTGTEAVPYTYPIYVGQTTLCGTLYVYDDGTHIFVNYELTDTATCDLAGLSEYHLQVDESFADLKKAVVKGKNPSPGQCEYDGYFDPMISETGYIKCTDDDISGWTTAYIFAHGVGCFICP
jgi:hypothetical protein